MSQKPRRDQILAILKKRGYVTVRELSAELCYSPATVYRDLDALQKQHLVKRSYGGVEWVNRRLPPLPYRYDWKRREKRHIGKAAAALIENGDTVFIDSSTTSSFIGAALEGKREVTVITNSMRLAAEVAEAGLTAVCLGGTVTEAPYNLFSDVTVENALSFHADKFFFSTGAFTAEGLIARDNAALLHKVMMKNAKKTYFLADGSKVVTDLSRSFCDFSVLEGVISDFAFSDETKAAFPSVTFLHVEE